MTRNPNSCCRICDAPIYRRPSDLRDHGPGLCKEHAVIAQSDRAKKHNAALYRRFIERWKQGLEAGMSGAGISSYIRRYLFEKHGNRCGECGWSEINQHTGRIPLEVNHIDGNHRNNLEDNLELLCPNCHSLTSTYRNLNKGNGRPRGDNPIGDGIGLETRRA